MKNFEGPARRDNQDSRNVLARILDTPHLERVVPRLQPELLHRVIQSCGLEDCGELVVLATPKQLARVFDLDLWRSGQPGMDEQFDAGRFGVWLEVLAEFGASVAAQKLAKIDADLVIAGLAQHARVFDGAAVASYRTTDGLEVEGTSELEHELGCDIGGYRLIAKRTDSWEAIVAILISLDAEHSDYFHRVMSGCRAISNDGHELDGLDDLLSDEQQDMFDVAVDREKRRDEQGYVTPAQARAFLEMSRELRLGSESMPAPNSIARAHLRQFDEATAFHVTAAEPTSENAVSSEDDSQAGAALINLLVESGIIGQQPRALLNASQDSSTALSRIHAHMQFVFDCDRASYLKRNEELTYLANSLMAGCSVQSRPFTAQEAWDAVVAVCNVGLENWPPSWISAKSLPDDFLITHDLVMVFQVGWTVLHKDVVMHSAQHLLKVLAGLSCEDPHLQSDLHTLRIKLSRAYADGIPWRARDALEVIAILDMPAWATLLGLIDEFPVLHAALSASRSPKTRSVNAAAFEFISQNSQIAAIYEFLQSLPETLDACAS
jgi:hypothetical protein